MNNPHDEMRVYLKRLISRYQNIDSMCRQVRDIDKWKAPGKRAAWTRGASFFQSATYGLRRIILVEVLTLLSKKPTDRSLFHWLNEAKEHSALLNPTRHNPTYKPDQLEPLTPEDYRSVIDGQLQQITTQATAIERIKMQRNKEIAHLDKLYFDSPGAIFDQYPISDADVDNLMGLIKAILKSHYSYLFASDLEISVYHLCTVDEMLKYTLGFIRMQEDAALRENGIYPDKYLSDDYSEAPRLGAGGEG